MERYLERIGYTGDRSPNRENLTRLLRCHLETVPFENLDFWQNPRQLPLQIVAVCEIAVAHGELIEIAEHGQIQFAGHVHNIHLVKLFGYIIRQFGKNSNPYFSFSGRSSGKIAH